MARKTKAFNYFHTFVELSDCGKKEASALANVLVDYTDIEERAIEIGNIEIDADRLVDKIIEEVNNSFITPIDREDIIGITESLDNVCDAIEDVANLFDVMSIEKVRVEAKEMSHLIKLAVDGLYDVMKAFEHFKNYKELKKMIDVVKDIEEQGDTLYHSTVKALFLEENISPVELMKWKNIFDDMERTLNDCERAAKLVGGLAIKNS